MVYTQAPHLTDKEIDDFLKKAPTVRICSINEDGTIHVVHVWFNVTLSIDEGSPSTRGVIVYGKAEVDYREWNTEAINKLEKYMSREEAEKSWQIMNEWAKWVKIIVSPERIASFDYDKDDKWQELLTKMGWK